jgi:hypothetical protein
MDEIELEQALRESARRQEREDELDAAKEKQIRENRKHEWTIFWQGGSPTIGKVSAYDGSVFPDSSREALPRVERFNEFPRIAPTHKPWRMP